MKRMYKFLAILLTMALILPGIAAGVVFAAPDQAAVTRLAGSNRIRTAIEVSKAVYTEGSDTVILAGTNGEVDALTATLLANKKNAPLLTVKDQLIEDIKAEIDRLGATKIYIVGGEQAVNSGIEDALKADYEVERIAGSNRAATAAAIAEECGTDGGVYLVNGYTGLADALLIGPVSAKEGKPVLLTNKDAIPAATIAALDALNVSRITLIGGAGVISDAIASSLEADGYSVSRVSGSNREETALAIANKYFAGSNSAVVANGGYSGVYADALVGGYLAAIINGPILFTRADRISDNTLTYIEENVDEAFVLGGDAVVNDIVFGKVEDAVEAEAEGLAVVSVSAINGLELQVTFSQPVDTNDVASNVNLSSYTWTKVDESKDKKTVTLEADSLIIADNDALVIDPVKSEDDSAVKSERYATLFTYEDTVAPFVVKNEGKDLSAEITFNEEVLSTDSGFGVSVDGTNIGTATSPISYAYASKVLTISGLENGKTYNVEIVGAKDTAVNVADPISLTVAPVKPADPAEQNVTISASGNKVTLNFVNAITSSSGEKVNFDPADFAFTGPITLNGTADTGVTYSNNEKTVVLDAQLLGIFGKTDTLETKVTVKLGGSLDDVEKTVTLTTDKVAPKLVKATAKADRTWTLEFNKAVKDNSLTFDVTHIGGVLLSTPKNQSSLTSAYAKEADGSTDILTTLVVTLTEGGSAPKEFVVGEANTVKFAAKAIEDIYGNESAEFTTVVTIPDVDPVDDKAIITVAAATVAPSSGGTQTLTLTFTTGGENLTDKSASAVNFTLGGKALPTGSKVEFVDNKTKIRITLPAGSVVTTGSYKLTLANIADLDGNTLDIKNGHDKQYVSLIENVLPTVKGVTTPTVDTIEVTFSETIKEASSPTTEVIVKINGEIVDLDGTTPTSISGDKLTINLDSGVDSLELGDKVSVEFKNSSITDTNGNAFADGTFAN